MSEIQNAKINSTHLGLEDHGIFTAFVYLRGDGWGQGFGGYDLRRGKLAFLFLDGVNQAVGVSRWEDLANTGCRVKREEGLIVAIGHIIDNRWFEPREVFKASA